MKHLKNAKLVKWRWVRSFRTLIMKSFFISRYTQHKHHNPRISYRFHSAAITNMISFIWIHIIFYEQNCVRRTLLRNIVLIVDCCKRNCFHKRFGDNKQRHSQKMFFIFERKDVPCIQLSLPYFQDSCRFTFRIRLNLFPRMKRVL